MGKDYRYKDWEGRFRFKAGDFVRIDSDELSLQDRLGDVAQVIHQAGSEHLCKSYALLYAKTGYSSGRNMEIGEPALEPATKEDFIEQLTEQSIEILKTCYERLPVGNPIADGGKIETGKYQNGDYVSWNGRVAQIISCTLEYGQRHHGLEFADNGFTSGGNIVENVLEPATKEDFVAAQNAGRIGRQRVADGGKIETGETGKKKIRMSHHIMPKDDLYKL
jgi:hypothetical protein